jgi:hypothetical protein
VQEDLKEYSASTHDQIAVKQAEGGLQIRHTAFFLQIAPDNNGQPLVHCIKTTTQGGTPVRFDIQIIAKGQSDFCYKINGKEFSSESEASEALLRPLLSTIPIP